ncbi:MAG: flagellar biosynthesis protein FliQ [Lachnospiraceae bacterium]|nr:flagellar biosynthesis protein FliQ [Lachnospiraceae bacterium]
MTIDDVQMIIGDGLFTILKTALPVLLVSLAVGLIVSIFQTVTSIHEQTLTFVPKVIAIFLTLTLVGNWMLNNMLAYIDGLWANFAVYIR